MPAAAGISPNGVAPSDVVRFAGSGLAKFVAPSDDAGKAALASAEFPAKTLPGSSAPDMRVWLFDPAGEQSYPITTFTWMLFYQDQDDAKAKVLRDMVEYSLTKGQAMAPKMGYIPLPDSVIARVRKAVALIQ